MAAMSDLIDEMSTKISIAPSIVFCTDLLYHIS